MYSGQSRFFKTATWLSKSAVVAPITNASARDLDKSGIFVRIENKEQRSTV